MANTPPLPTPSRRAFLLGIGATPVAAARWQRDDGDDMAAVGRLCDLEFADAERTQAEARLASQREAYRALRSRPFPFALPPCQGFDPIVPGTPVPPAGPGISFAPRLDLPAPQGDSDIAFAAVEQLASWLRQGHVSSRQLTELALQRLQRFDPELHCVITLLGDEALATADLRDRELAQGKARGPLHGIPFGAKDLFAWPGAPTTFGAAPFRDHVWDLRATVLARLHDAGAVLVAKLALGALAMGDLWYGGRTRNPWNKAQGSSGSSAGSACAVAAGLVPFALGTESLGSIVSPCRQCGIGGLRPTFGAVSRHGAMPLSWTMDKVGPIARSALGLALVFDTIRGADGCDPAARDAAFPFVPERGLDGLRLGVLQGDKVLQREEDQRFLGWLEEQGCKQRPVQLPEAPYQAMLLMLHAEAAAAFDELLRQGKLGLLPGQDASDWPNQFRSARCIPAVEYVQASRLRRQLQIDTQQALRDIDVLVAPTHGGPTMTCTNLTGHPTLVLPIGTSSRDGGRPSVLGLTGQLHGEASLLTVAAAWQRTTNWHQQRPPLTA